MRGLAAHSNGFQTVRALAVLMSVLGTIDRPGGFRHKAPYPRHIVPNFRAFNSPDMIKPNTPLNAAPLGFPASPDELAIDDDGTPMRIDHAFSWEHPLSAHGLMHTVITNATRGDPYRLDTLLIFMSNMAWNSTMNTVAVREMLNRKNADGEYQIPFLVVCDAFQSETVAFADLVLPDTTYLERHDVMSMLDRPISEFDGPADSVRVPVVAPHGECKPFQEVLVELASRLKLPAFTTAEGGRKFKDYPDFVVNFEPQPGIGFLMGWRGKDGDQHLRGAPNPKQWEMYANNDCVFHYPLPETMHYMRNWNRDYLDFAKDKGWRQKNDVVQLALYSDTLQTLSPRRAGQDAGPPAARASARAHRDLLRPAAVLVSAARGRGDRHWRAIRSTRSRSGRWRCTTRGIRRTPGCARSTATTTCTSIRARPQRPASPTAAGAGSRANGARCAAWSATARRSSRERCGPGTRSARPTAPGSSRPAPTKRGRASS